MNELMNFDFSEFSFLGIIILAVFLYLILKIIDIIFIRKISSIRIKYSYPLFMLVVWFGFILWSITILLKDSVYYTMAILSIAAIILLGIAWFVSRDLFAGIVLRFTDNFTNGQSLIVAQTSGRIAEIGLLGITLIMQDETVVKIPWSRISGQIYIKGDIDNSSDRQNFQLKVPQTHPLEIIQLKIREAVFLSVGAVLNKEPQIKILGVANNEWQLEITVFASGSKYLRNIIENIKEALNIIQ